MLVSFTDCSTSGICHIWTDMDDGYILRGTLSCMNDFYYYWVGIRKTFNIGFCLVNTGDSALCFKYMTDMDEDYILRGHCHT